jgi:hypothetical protein
MEHWVDHPAGASPLGYVAMLRLSVRLTPSAYAHGFALALPEKVAVARPEVSDFTTS